MNNCLGHLIVWFWHLFGTWIFVFGFCPSSVYAQDYTWPLDTLPAVTSSFAEYRSGHFHSGIDLKTWGKTGFKVFAVADGYVSRLFVAPFGYGKAVYLTLPDSQLVVYGHLSGMNDSLAACVEQEQEKNGRFRVDLPLPPGRFPVKKGDLLGFSGRSATPAPHLHFEIRDKHNLPINPQENGFIIKDTTPPRLLKVMVRPLNMSATVMGGHNYYLAPLVYNEKEKNYICPEAIRVVGDIGIGIECFDLADQAPNEINIYRLELSLDDSLLFRTSYDRFAIPESYKICLDRDYEINRHGDGIFQKLYCDIGNDLSFYFYPDEQKGLLRTDHLRPGPHDLTIKALDAQGNSAVARVTLIADRPPVIERIRDNGAETLLVEATDPEDTSIVARGEYSTDSGQHWWPLAASRRSGMSYALAKPKEKRPYIVKAIVADPWRAISAPAFYFGNMDSSAKKSISAPVIEDNLTYYRDFMVWQVRASRPLVSLPIITATPNHGPVETLMAARHDLQEYSVDVPLLNKYCDTLFLQCRYFDDPHTPYDFIHSLPLYRIKADSAGSRSFADSAITLDWPPHAVFTDVFLRFKKQPAPASEVIGLNCLTSCYGFAPNDVPLNKAMSISCKVPDNVKDVRKVGLYAGYGSWAFVGNTYDPQKKTITGKMGSFGTFALVEDLVPPVIADLSPANGETLHTALPRLQAMVTDQGSGFNDLMIEMKLDTSKVIFEWDPIIKTVFYQTKKPLAPGRHTMTIAMRDNAYNTAKRSVTFWTK
jgi:hypothetical protein